MMTLRRAAVLVTAVTIAIGGFAGVGAADSGAQSGIAVETSADAIGDSMAFADSQTTSSGFSHQNPYVSVSVSTSSGGGSAVAYSVDHDV